MKISEKIKFQRKEVMNLKQKELAPMIGVSVATLKKWENDENFPNVNHLIMISLACNISLQYLIYDNHDEELSQIGLDDEEYNILWSIIEYFRKKNIEEGINCE